jgi:hypothetical protein
MTSEPLKKSNNAVQSKNLQASKRLKNKKLNVSEEQQDHKI